MIRGLVYTLNYLFVFTLLIAETGAGKLNFKPRFERKLNLLWKNVHENTNPGFEIADISEYAIDDEGDDMTFAIDAKGSEICTIGRTDGKLKLKISPDREKQAVYEFVVTVSDDYGDGTNRATSLDIYLYILDRNDNRPMFQKSPYHTKISEATEVGSQILRVIATDLDTGRNKDIRYIFVSNKKHDKFSLDPNTGIISVKSKLDYESKCTYTFDVIAEDDGLPSLSTTTRVLVDIIDNGDNKPIFDFNMSDKEIKENIRVGSSVAYVHALDGDKAINNKINYVIVGGNDNGLFQIKQETGNITVAGILDRELYKSFQLKIKAYEVPQPDSFATTDVKIRLIDENDNKPEFKQNAYLIQIDEDKIFPMTVLTNDIKAVDNDVTWPNNQIIYWMKRNKYFKVLPESGTIILKKTVKVQSKGILQFTLYATEKDTKEKYTAKTNVTVLVIKTPRVVHAKSISNGYSLISNMNLVLVIICSKLIHIILNT